MDLLSVLYEDFQVFPRSLPAHDRTWTSSVYLSKIFLSRIGSLIQIIVCHSVFVPENIFTLVLFKIRLDVRVFKESRYHPHPYLCCELIEKKRVWYLGTKILFIIDKEDIGECDLYPWTSNFLLKVKVAQLCPTLCNPMDCPWDSLGQNTGVGSLSLFQLPLTGPQNWTDLILQSQAGVGDLLCRTSSGKELKRWVLPLGNLLPRAKSWTTYAQFFILNCQSNDIIPPDLRKIEWGDTDKLRYS